MQVELWEVITLVFIPVFGAAFMLLWVMLGRNASKSEHEVAQLRLDMEKRTEQGRADRGDLWVELRRMERDSAELAKNIFSTFATNENMDKMEERIEKSIADARNYLERVIREMSK